MSSYYWGVSIVVLASSVIAMIWLIEGTNELQRFLGDLEELDSIEIGDQIIEGDRIRVCKENRCYNLITILNDTFTEINLLQYFLLFLTIMIFATNVVIFFPKKKEKSNDSKG